MAVVGNRQLADLLIDPRETLEVELKGWLDITNNNEQKATLAKALIALANHGGGFALIGWTRSETGSQPAPHRPETLSAFNTDTVNAIIAAYAEPQFHCDVSIEAAPDGEQYPIIVVPGGHSVPIHSRRDGPNGQTVRRLTYYIRRPGPMSEGPQNAQEWSTLIRRCISNAKDDLLDQIRTIIAGGGSTPTAKTDDERLREWFAQSMARWSEVIAQTPEDGQSRMPMGHFAAAYQLAGTFPQIGMADLRDVADRSTVRHTGWPPFWVPTRQEIAPYISNGALECWLGRDGAERDAAHADFWRLSPRGEAFLIRGYQEDTPNNRKLAPGTGFDLTIPTWRTGEVLLHAASFAAHLGDASALITISFEWTGLAQRQIVTLGNPNRLMIDGHTAHQDTYRKTISVQADQVSGSLPELVGQIMAPLYELFDFFRLPARLVAEELSSMRSNQH
jgi:hypothetical protein